MANIYVIGSLGRDEKIKKTANYYKRLGNNVEYVKKQPHLPCRKLVEECFNKIEKADEVVVIPKCDGSIGIGVTYEIMFANRVGTKVTILNEQDNEEKEKK